MRYGKKKSEYRLMSTSELEKEMTYLKNKIGKEQNTKRKQAYLRANGRVVDVLRERNYWQSYYKKYMQQYEKMAK